MSCTAPVAATAQAKITRSQTNRLTNAHKEVAHNDNEYKSVGDNDNNSNNSIDNDVDSESETINAAKALDDETSQEEPLPEPSALDEPGILTTDARGGVASFETRECMNRKGNNEMDAGTISLGKRNDSPDPINNSIHAIVGSLSSDSSSSSPPSTSSALRPPPVLAPSWYLPIRPCDVDTTAVPSVPLHIFAYDNDGHEDQDADVILGEVDWTREFPSDVELTSTLLDFINDQGQELESFALTCL